MFRSVDIREGVFGKVIYDDDGNEIEFRPAGRAVKLEAICQGVETNLMTWRVSFQYLKRQRYAEIARSKIGDKTMVSDLQGRGADVTAKNFNLFVDSMRLQEGQMTTAVPVFEKTGWIDFAGKRFFRCNALIGHSSGEYVGSLALSPHGTFEAWRDMIVNDVLGRTPLEVVLIASMSAIVNGAIARDTTGENPIIHLCSGSSQGKSTAAFVAASVFGEPFEGGRTVPDRYSGSKTVQSVLGSWSATENAVITANSGNQGVAVILNEIGKFLGNDFTRIIYALSEGTDKRRLNAEYRANVGEGFATTIISVGEISILEKCKSKAKGLDARVMEIDAVFTDSAEHSASLKRGSRENHGWACPKLAEYILEMGSENLVNRYRSIAKAEKQGEAPEKHRFIEKFTALFLTTAQIASEALGIPFNLPAIKGFCDDFWGTKVLKNGTVSKSFEEVIEQCEVHRSNFLEGASVEHIPNLWWGRIREPNTIVNGKQLVREYAIFPKILKDILQDLGYENATTELKVWRDKGALCCDANHLSKKVLVDPKHSRSSRVYVLQVWAPLLPPPTSVVIAPPALVTASVENGKSPKQISKQLAELLAPEEEGEAFVAEEEVADGANA